MLNKKQKKIILIAAILIFVMAVFPPWYDTLYVPFSLHLQVPWMNTPDWSPPAESFPQDVAVPAGDALGYSFIFLPPEGQTMLDIGRLLVQWATVIIVAFAGVLLLQEKDTHD